MEMTTKIDGIDFHNLDIQRYWTHPASYGEERKRIEITEMVQNGQYIGSEKKDGALYRFVKYMDGTMELLGRSKGVGGDYLNKIDWVPHLHSFFESLPVGTCLLGEIYFPEKPGSTNTTSIMGCLKEKAVARQAAGPKISYYVFDVLAYNGVSYIKEKVENRVAVLNNLYARHQNRENVEFAHYLEGMELWDELARILARGGEGIVITKKGTCYEPGKRKARQTLKIKKEIQQTIDCFFTGRATAPTREYSGKELPSWKYWENIITGEKIEGPLYKDYTEGKPIQPVTKPYFHKWAGSLEIGVLKDGKVVPIGFLSGLSEELKANFKDYAMRPIEVTAMEIFAPEQGGGLRHAKMIGWRNDLSVEDCTWQKIHG